MCLRFLRFVIFGGPVAADLMCLLTSERRDGKSVALYAIVAAPAIQFDRALNINPIALFQIGCGFRGLAKHRNGNPLHCVVLANTDAHSHPRLAGLRRARLGVGGAKTVKRAIDHGVRSFAVPIASAIAARERED
jgi:hypothetical protein